MKTGYSEEGELVVLRMTRDDYNRLLMLMGYATASAENKSQGALPWTLPLLNRLNDGNPRFTPYEIPKEVATTRRPQEQYPD